MENILKSQILAFIPIYHKNKGDSTKIFLEKREVILKINIKSFLKQLTKYYMLDLKELKKIYSCYLTSKNLLPIALDQFNIFIPIKSRLPIFPNDKAFGYLNLNSIHKYKEDKDGKSTLILLNNNKIIRSLSTLKTFEKHRKNGNIIKSCFKKRKMEGPGNTRELNSYEELIKIREEISILKFLIKNQ